MLLSASNYGPIREANIELKPLTIFVGPSNTGKSYLAILLYSILNSGGSPAFGLGRRYPHHFGPSFHGQPSTRFSIRDVRDLIETLDRSANGAADFAFDNLPNSIKESFNFAANSALRRSVDNLRTELMRCFATNLENIASDSSRNRRFRISLRGTGGSWGWEVTSTGNNFDDFSSFFDSSKVKIKYMRNELVEATNSYQHELFAEPEDAEHPYLLPSAFDLSLYLISYPLQRLFEELGSETFYLPAARSGVLQSHRVIASALVRRAPFAGIQEFAIPQLSGVLTDFIGHLLTLDESEESSVSEVSNMLESEILGGKIALERSQTQYPDLYYNVRNHRYPMSSSSSMVSELAPVALFARYLVAPSDTLIIEEPESHLHPEMQRKMATMIAALVSRGVKVVVTTHSDYFLDQISNLITAGALPRTKREQFPTLSSLALDENDVGLYLFERPTRGGTRVRQLEVTSGGIHQPDSDSVAESLYDETVALREALLGPHQS